MGEKCFPTAVSRLLFVDSVQLESEKSGTKAIDAGGRNTAVR